jgi:hypothetical protein
MKNLYICAVFAGLATLSGCAMRDTQSSSGTTVPSGPVVASTNRTNVIPSGTQLVIRTNQNIQTTQAGQTFDAEVARDIQNESGKILVPKGSRAELVVMDATSGGAVGTAKLELGIQSITIEGKKYNVASDVSQQRGREGLGTNQRTAEMVGGGALLGTLIGAVAGGGSGAAIGAAVGAAGGAATQVLTRGNEVRVPAETLLTFQLQQPIRMQG